MHVIIYILIAILSVALLSATLLYITHNRRKGFTKEEELMFGNSVSGDILKKEGCLSGGFYILDRKRQEMARAAVNPNGRSAKKGTKKGAMKGAELLVGGDDAVYVYVVLKLGLNCSKAGGSNKRYTKYLDRDAGGQYDTLFDVTNLDDVCEINYHDANPYRLATCFGISDNLREAADYAVRYFSNADINIAADARRFYDKIKTLVTGFNAEYAGDKVVGSLSYTFDEWAFVYDRIMTCHREIKTSVIPTNERPLTDLKNSINIISNRYRDCIPEILDTLFNNWIASCEEVLEKKYKSLFGGGKGIPNDKSENHYFNLLEHCVSHVQWISNKIYNYINTKNFIKPFLDHLPYAFEFFLSSFTGLCEAFMHDSLYVHTCEFVNARLGNYANIINMYRGNGPFDGLPAEGSLSNLDWICKNNSDSEVILIRLNVTGMPDDFVYQLVREHVAPCAEEIIQTVQDDLKVYALTPEKRKALFLFYLRKANGIDVGGYANYPPWMKSPESSAWCKYLRRNDPCNVASNVHTNAFNRRIREMMQQYNLGLSQDQQLNPDAFINNGVIP